jgi:hypothetical protein
MKTKKNIKINPFVTSNKLYGNKLIPATTTATLRKQRQSYQQKKSIDTSTMVTINFLSNPKKKTNEDEKKNQF